MNCFRPASLRGGEDFIASKIAFYGRRRSDMNRFIGLADVQRLRVRIRINGDSSNAHLTRRANDPASDLSAIGDEERLDHGEASCILSETVSRRKPPRSTTKGTRCISRPTFGTHRRSQPPLWARARKAL